MYNTLLQHPLFQKLLSLSIPTQDYAVIGSQCLYIHGLIGIGNDIDIIARHTAWEIASQIAEPMVPKSKVGKVIELFDNSIEIFDTWAPGEWNVDELIDTAETIGGIRFVTLENVRKWKTLIGRPKDFEHIKLIDNYLCVD
jgi:hypothetical protein